MQSSARRAVVPLVFAFPRALAAAAAAALAVVALAQSLAVSQAGERVRIAAPELHFLRGKPLERLQSGNSVAFDFQLSALGEGRQSVLQRMFERFVVSYDLWEQTYSVSRMRSQRGSVSHLTAAQAEAWCLDNITLTASTLPKEQPLWFRLEVRAQEQKADDPALDDPGTSLSGLMIDIFSRAGRVRGGADHWRLETGPVRLRR